MVDGAAGVQYGLHWGEARGGANRVVIGVFDMGEMDVPVVLVFVTDHG